MKISFSKYQGTGNDFVMIDNRSGAYDSLSVADITKLCDRRFGIGADGLIRIGTHPSLDFDVDYYNSDGSKSFCGNGARCSVAFAASLGIVRGETRFMAIDGAHEASIENGIVSLKMSDVSGVRQRSPGDCVLDTGSPHYIVFTNEDVDVYKEGRRIRWSDEFSAKGINVNFVKELGNDRLRVLTYERGVEDETLSCGTGVTAAAIAYAVKTGVQGRSSMEIETKGGKLAVRFDRSGDRFTDIFLIGPAEFVFSGETGL
jgi:diaminopimelate epimerase